MALRSAVSRLIRLNYPLVNNSYNLFGRSHQSDMAGEPMKDIKFDSLKDKVLSGSITLIDVREPNELKGDGKIPNSVNIPLGKIVEAFELTEQEFKKRYGISKPDKHDNFVLSCRSGKRAENAFNKLIPLGYKNILVYSGSFQDWHRNGGPLEKQ